MFKITTEWIMANRTAKGSWTGAQMRAIGGNFKGWVHKLDGKLITIEAKEKFENAACIYAKPKKEKQVLAKILKKGNPNDKKAMISIKRLMDLSGKYNFCISIEIGEKDCPHCWRARFDNQYNNDYKFLT